MQTKLTNRPVEQAVAAIQALDLEPIRLKVMDGELGEGWTREHAENIERAYRDYLRMLVKHPEDLEDIAVSKDVDEFWHAHILHTMKYTEDCERVFGNYLHHNPHVGERTQADVEKKAALAEKTRRLYQQEFGGASDRPEGAAWCSAAVSAEKTTWCSSAIEIKQAAWCSSSVKTESAAWCSAAVKGKDAAWCSATIKLENATWCSAAVGSKETAWCSGAVEAKNVAWCSGAVRARKVAWCSGTIKVQNAAWCSAAVEDKEASWCSAAVEPRGDSSSVLRGTESFGTSPSQQTP